MKPSHCHRLAAFWIFGFVLAVSVRAEWQRTETSLAWREKDAVVWKFSFDPKAGKPFFHPLSVGGKSSLTDFKPGDHPWHYGLWFSWKYINRVNYWEEDRTSGRAEGATHWTTPVIETEPDGTAIVRFAVHYVHPSGRVDVSETREIKISAPAKDGSYAIDWHGHFQAGIAGVDLDRTPLPNEPNGQPGGGYAGLSLRLASLPVVFSAVTSHGVISEYKQDRSRPTASVVAFNLKKESEFLGGVAIMDDSKNSDHEASWYIANSTQMHWACAAVLAPKPLHYEPGAEWDLRYRILLRPAEWTPEDLRKLELK
ncbi:MAG: PmoA family protein [Nibricoccus sp.]